MSVFNKSGVANRRGDGFFYKIKRTLGSYFLIKVVMIKTNNKQKIIKSTFAKITRTISLNDFCFVFSLPKNTK